MIRWVLLVSMLGLAVQTAHASEPDVDYGQVPPALSAIIVAQNERALGTRARIQGGLRSGSAVRSNFTRTRAILSAPR